MNRPQVFYLFQDIQTGRFLTAREEMLPPGERMTRSMQKATPFSATQLVRYVAAFGKLYPDTDFLKFYMVISVVLEKTTTTTIVVA